MSLQSNFSSHIPTFTILLPVKNNIKTIKNVVTQIVSSIDDNDEVVIIDDGSSDGSFELLQNLVSQNEKLFLFRSPGNGLVDALNFGIDKANKEWIARFDGDDYYSLDRLRETRKILSPDIAAVFCDYMITNSSNENLGIFPGAIFEELVPLSLFSSSRTPHPGVVINTKLAREVGGYFASDYPAEDLSLWIRLSKAGKLVTIPKVFLHYRLSLNSITGSNRGSIIEKKNSLLKNFDYDQLNFRMAIEKFCVNPDLYRDFPYSMRRNLLALREIILVLRYKKKLFRTLNVNMKIKLLGKILSLLSIELLIESYKLSIELKKRNNFRKFGK